MAAMEPSREAIAAMGRSYGPSRMGMDAMPRTVAPSRLF